MKLAFGVSGPLGQAWFSESKTRALVRQALEGGVTHFDTAPFYFDAERRLGEALKDKRAFISTKTGTRRKGSRLIKDFSPEGMRADADQSRRSLFRDTLDLFYLHGPNIEQIIETRATLDALKRDGVVSRIGVCGEGDALAFAAENGFDAIMGAYNIIDRRHEEIFSDAKKRGVMTVAVAPLAQGLFDPRFNAPRTAGDLWRLARARFRPRYSPAAIAAARRALGDADPAGKALAFVLSNPSIDVVVTTTTKPAHLAQSLGAKPFAPADAATLNALHLDGEEARA